MRKPDGWETIQLLGCYDVTFDFTGYCKLNLRKGNEKNLECPVVINNAEFTILRKGDWITIEIFEEEIAKLLKNTAFEKECFDQKK